MKIISAICHPLLMATYMSIALLFIAPELFAARFRSEWAFLVAVFLTTFVVPALSILSMRMFAIITSLEITDKRQRLLPFSIILLLYSTTSYLFAERFRVGEPFTTLFISATVLIAILLVITNWFKISIHASAIWSAVGILSAMIITTQVEPGFPYYLLIVLAGLTNASRLYLGYHTPSQVWAGTILGFVFSFCWMLFLG